MRKTSELESDISKAFPYNRLYFHYGQRELKETIQPALLKLLIDFDKICQENGIQYMIVAGTLLGAVREKGFIAWDDDIDVLVPAGSFSKIQRAIERSGFDKDYQFIPPYQSEVVTVDGKFMSKRITLGTLMGDCSIGYPIYLDVLEYHNVPDNILLLNLKSCLSQILFLSYSSLRCLKKNDELLDIMSKDSVHLKVNLLIRRIISIPAIIIGQRRTYLLMEKISGYKCETSKYVTVPFGALRYKKEIVPREVFSSSVKKTFEGHDFFAPRGYQCYLENRYGLDYMTPPPKAMQGIKCFQKREDWKSIIKYL